MALGVGDDDGRLRQPQRVRQDLALLAPLTAAPLPIRAAPSQKYTHRACTGTAHRLARLTPSSESTLAAAHERSRICANVTGVPAIDIMTRSPNCSAR
jgi:hypothetical protein